MVRYAKQRSPEAIRGISSILPIVRKSNRLASGNISLFQLVILLGAEYITMKEASKKYGFTLSFLRNKICDGLLDSRKEYVKYKPPYNTKGSHCMRRVIVVNEDQVKKLKLWEPKKPPSEAWIRQHIRSGFTQKQMAIKYDINEHRLSKAIHELGLARSPAEVGQLRLRKDKPHIEKAKILRVVEPPKSMQIGRASCRERV